MPLKTCCLLFIGVLASIFATGDACADYTGKWDSTIYNLLEHPRTVALRIEVIDTETHLPIPGAAISLKGTYITEARTSRHPQGEKPRQKKEYDLSAKTDKDGVAVLAVGWQKEYPWRPGPVDDIEKVQQIEVRHGGYRFKAFDSPFARFLQIGQKNGSHAQEPVIIKKFEALWSAEGKRNDVKYCTLDLGGTFKDFNNKLSSSPQFFEKIRDKEWGTLYEKPRNWFSKGEHPQSLCGPYFVYLIQVRMQRIRDSQASAHDYPGRAISTVPQALSFAHFAALQEDHAVPARDVKWGINFLKGVKWGMSGTDVEKVLNDSGYELTIVGNFTLPNSGAVTHRAKVSGQLLYGKIRVHEIQMGFIDSKLTSINFVTVNESDSEALYSQSREMFGPGLEKTWVDEEVRKDRGRAEPSSMCDRYFYPTAVQSRVSYSWSAAKKRHIRYGSLNLFDWRAVDKAYGRDHTLDAKRFGHLLKKAGEGRKTTCTGCNGSGKCIHCKGEGYSYEEEFYTCSDRRCRGKGQFQVYGFGGGIRACPRCNGTGKLKTGKRIKKTCVKCGGLGKCRTCNGEACVSTPR